MSSLVQKKLQETMADEKKILDPSDMEIERGVYPMYFGISCAFAFLHLVNKLNMRNGNHGIHSCLVKTMLKGSSQLLGLLVMQAQQCKEVLEGKLRKAELEVEELKRRRTEDAKANEKVAGIFAAHEQNWIAEKKSLKNQIQTFFKELQTAKAMNEETVISLRRRIEENEEMKRSMDEAFEEEVKKRRELEMKLQLSQKSVDELTERAKKMAQDYSADLWKHKTALAELISNKQEVEAERYRALREVEMTKIELEKMFRCKEEAIAIVRKLSREIAKKQRDSEHNDKILSILLMKSEAADAKKHILQKEVKSFKAKLKQAELDLERWRKISELRFRKHSNHCAESESSQNQRLVVPNEIIPSYNQTVFRQGCFKAEGRQNHDYSTDESSATGRSVERFECRSNGVNGEPELAVNELQHLQCCNQLKSDKLFSNTGEKQYLRTEAFTQQLMQKDERLEALNRRIFDMELESKRLQSRIRGLDEKLIHFRDENCNLEALLLEKEKELDVLKEKMKLTTTKIHKKNENNSRTPESRKPQLFPTGLKTIKTKCGQEFKQDTKVTSVQDILNSEKNIESNGRYACDNRNLFHSESDIILQEIRSTYLRTISLASSLSPDNYNSNSVDRNCNALSSENSAKDMTLFTAEETNEDREVRVEQGNAEEAKCSESISGTGKSLSGIQPTITRNNSSGKMDIQALGVSYKIRRLKQQLLVLENLALSETTKQKSLQDDKQSASTDDRNDQNEHVKDFLPAKALLNKQLQRYQFLEDKIYDLCRRMNETKHGSRDEFVVGSANVETETLQSLLKQTFQLQRYMVGVNQKLVEIQPRIASGFLTIDGLAESTGFNVTQFADIVTALCREVQQGLEVQMSRIIGDIAGTLACNGILQC